jgi:inner membrane protein
MRYGLMQAESCARLFAPQVESAFMAMPSSLPRSRSLGGKFFIVAALTLLLAIPLFMVFLITWDRSSTANQVKRDITQGWGQVQTVRGPYLVIPFSQVITGISEENGKQRQVQSIVNDAVVIAPTTFKADVQLKPERRRRALFEVILYDARINLSGHYDMPDLKALNVKPTDLKLDRTYVMLDVSDAKGISGGLPQISVGGAARDLKPGAHEFNLPGASISAMVDPAALLQGKPLAFNTSLRLKGSTTFSVQSIAKASEVRIRSAWSAPSFVGGFLPDTRRVDATGFDASWSTTYLAQNKPVEWRAAANNINPADDQMAVGVSLIEPVDLYGQATRAAKYGILFIAFTFLAYFLFEVVGKAAVHPVEYTLAGLGLILFFLLMLSGAEYLGFGKAYWLAALTMIALLTAYSKAVLKSGKRALGIFGLLLGLYAFLYVLLQLEDYALLLGSLVLLLALATVMYITRHVNWRGSGQIGTDNHG